MAPKLRSIFVTFVAVLAMAVFVAITTWAAVPKSHGDSAAPAWAKGVNDRPDLRKVY